MAGFLLSPFTTARLAWADGFLLNFDDDLAGPPIDTSPNAVPVSLSLGAAIADGVAKPGFGRALSTTDFDSYFQINAGALLPIGTADFVFEGWIYRNIDTASSVGSTMFTTVAYPTDTSANTNYDLYIAYNATMQLVAAARNSAGVLTTITSSAVTTASWIHVALSRANGVVRFFRNGALVGSFGTAGSSWNYTTSQRWMGALNSPFLGSGPANRKGLIGLRDGFRFKIGEARYTASFTVPTAPPTW